MVIIRDEARIERLSKYGRWAGLFGLLVLLGGAFSVFLPAETQEAQGRLIIYQAIALPVGMVLSQIGIYITNRYLRNPRPDEVLDAALRKVARNGRLYHYIHSIPHLLLLPTGIVILVAKYQKGEISAEGNKWRQKGVGFMSRLFAQEGVGNPSRETKILVDTLVNYLRKEAPQVDEVRIAPVVVFTSDNASVDVKNADVAALHYSKLKGFMKEEKRQNVDPMSAADYEAIQAALDKKIPDHLSPIEA